MGKAILRCQIVVEHVGIAKAVRVSLPEKDPSLH